MLSRSFAVRIVLALVGMVGAGSTHAFCVNIPDANMASVSERYDPGTDRFFLKWHSSKGACAAGLEHPAPPGTVPTGAQWSTVAYAAAGPFGTPAGTDERAMCEFVAAVGAQPPTVFLTINAGECAALKRPGSGWTYVPMSTDDFSGGDASLSGFEVNPTTLQCGDSLTPVYRFTNNAWDSGRGNHRYVLDAKILAQMRTRPGWTEEGIAFCAWAQATSPLAGGSFWLGDLLEPNGYAAVRCTNGIGNFNWCIESANLPALASARGPLDPALLAAYAARTGSGENTVQGVPGTDSVNASQHSFAQIGQYLAPGGGFYVDSADRTSGNISSITARNLVVVPPGAYVGGDWTELAHPFARYDVPMDLVLTYRLFVKEVRAEGDGNAAYVQAMLTLVDSSSGHRLVLSPGGIGTVRSVDLAAVDAASGNALVAVALGTSTIGRSTGLPSLQVAGALSGEAAAAGGAFAYRINRDEFVRAIAMARTIDPALSTDPAAYSVESFGIKGEVVGQSAIGYDLENMAISLERP